MKSIKKGFSLAELLIAMGIVSVIATLGFSIAKKGIEDAYDMYVYTGYNGIVTAISHAQARNILITDNMDKFIEDLNETLSGKTKTNPIIAPNGISYEFKEGTTNQYVIKMIIPAVKKKDNNGKNTVCLNYAPNEDWGILIPLDTTECESSIKNVIDRMDLLPFFIDDGNVGRRKPPEMKYKARYFLSARQAICGALKEDGENITINGVSVDCTSPKAKIPEEHILQGKIRLTHPKKAS